MYSFFVKNGIIILNVELVISDIFLLSIDHLTTDKHVTNHFAWNIIIETFKLFWPKINVAIHFLG